MATLGGVVTELDVRVDVALVPRGMSTIAVVLAPGARADVTADFVTVIAGETSPVASGSVVELG